ncbi:hypothetical protein [Glycomyces sp. YM15]|uniref:hypothetical protein n=1 Tax=Glycomyces sp. YM15 TaxID=2800446 RepID=UPI00196570EA|nr:hypothetical protein [Glycomyces sp. YM15]
MQYKPMVVASAVAAAAAAFSCAQASASTPDWLTVASVETGPTALTAVCEEEAAGTFADPACASILGTGGSPGAEAFDAANAEASADNAGMSAVNVDMRDFAKWNVCGVAVAAAPDDVECDNSIADKREPMATGSGVSLVNVDATGAFDWNVCGVAVLQSGAAVDC